jgi:Alginate lyase
MRRRNFLALGAAAMTARGAAALDVRAIDRDRILKAAQAYLKEEPVTVTASHSSRSAGGLHDYFSEGDYWWPDPKNPDGPYIQRDGMSNPGNFDDHRKALLRLSVQAPALCAAWLETEDKRFAEHAAKHLHAWFVHPASRMNPNLLYAQAIHGKVTGRGTGIIDTIHFVEVVRGATSIQSSGAISKPEWAEIQKWFADYLKWITTHEYGITERDAANNHGTCWVMQAAEFARFTGNAEVTAFCKDRFRTKLLPQIAADGSYPLELKRTKSYGYCLFNLETMSTACRILSTNEENLWPGMKKAFDFMVPFIADKKRWPYPPDVMYFDQWPVRQVALLFGGLAYGDHSYLDIWKRLNPDPTVEETIRNYPIRQPVLWV